MQSAAFENPPNNRREKPPTKKPAPQRVSLYEQEPSHVLRDELSPEQLKSIFRDHRRLIEAEGARRRSGSREPFLRYHEIAEELTAALTTQEQWEALHARVRRDYPRFAHSAAQADIQQRLAEQLISDSKTTLEAIREKRKLYGSQEEYLGLSGPEGLAAAYDLFQRQKHECFYPEPVLDALVKLDFATFNAETNRYNFFQLKTEDDLDADEPYILAAPEEFRRMLDDPESFLGRKAREYPDEIHKLEQDMKTLERFAQDCEKRYSETFASYYLALPSLRSPAHRVYCDKKTGLPTRNFPVIQISE